VDKSLLRSVEEDDEGCFAMLQTVREYALERLEERSEEAVETRRSHARYFCNIGKEAKEGLEGREQDRWLRALDRRVDDLRAALTFALDGAMLVEGAAAVLGLYGYWVRRQLRETEGWINRALAHEAVLSPSQRAWLHFHHGDVLGGLGRYEDAIARYGSTAAELEALSDQEGVGLVYNNLASVFNRRGEHERSAELYEKQIAVARTSGLVQVLALRLCNLGTTLYNMGKYHQAVPLLDEATAISEQIGDEGTLATAQGTLGSVYVRLGEPERGMSLLGEALVASRGDRPQILGFALDLALFAAETGQVEPAARLLGAVTVTAETTDLIFSASDNADVERIEEQLRGQMDTMRCLALIEEGRRMDLEGLVDYVQSFLSQDRQTH
jgi:tetratricopeptide (TPR) repeat protein